MVAHLHNLNPNQLNEVLKNFNKIVWNEKIDGIACQFGINDNDELYIVMPYRNETFTNVEDIPVEFAYLAYRSFFQALKKNEFRLREAGLTEGVELDAQLIYDQRPNVIRYCMYLDDSVAYLTKVTKGKMDLYKFARHIEYDSILVKSKKGKTDGLTAEYFDISVSWMISDTTLAWLIKLDDESRAKAIDLELFLNSESNYEGMLRSKVADLKLNTLKKADRELAKIERDHIFEYSKGIGSFIRERLIDTWVRSDVLARVIEGLVGTYKGIEFKLVDDKFLIEAANHLRAVRNQINKRATSKDSTNQSLISNLRMVMAESINNEELGYGNLTANKLVRVSHDFDCKDIKDSWIELISDTLDELERHRNWFLFRCTAFNKEMNLGSGRIIEFEYDFITKQKTLESFYNARKFLLEMERAVQNINTAQDAIDIMKRF